jgi:hypothetical protein
MTPEGSKAAQPAASGSRWGFQGRKAVRPLLLARNHHIAIGAGEKLYVIGGRVGSGFISSASNNVDLVEMYDPASDLWAPRARMPTPRSAIAGGLYNNYILVAGGEVQDQRTLAGSRQSKRTTPRTTHGRCFLPRRTSAMGSLPRSLATVSMP